MLNERHQTEGIHTVDSIHMISRKEQNYRDRSVFAGTLNEGKKFDYKGGLGKSWGG